MPLQITAPDKVSRTAFIARTINLPLPLYCQIHATPNQIRVELSAPHGQLTLSTVAGLTFESGNGSGDEYVAFSGHPGDVNRALRGAIYRGDPHWNTLDHELNALTIVVSNSHAGLGGLEPVAVEATHKMW